MVTIIGALNGFFSFYINNLDQTLQFLERVSNANL